MTSIEWAIAIALIAPLTAGLVILALPRKLSEPVSLLTTIITAVATFSLLPHVLAGESVDLAVLQLMPGVSIAFNLDGLGMTFALLATGLWVIVNIYNSGYIRADHLKHTRRYLGSFAASIGAAVGIAFAGNLLTFLLFYELLTLATYPLVVHKETTKAINAGRRYLLFALSGGLAVTAGSVWIWSLTGTLDFVPGGFMTEVAALPTLLTIFGLLISGCAVKAAIMPMHSWLPAAMVAPSPVSALLHAVAVVKAGVFGCMRVLGYVFGPESIGSTGGQTVLLFMCGLTIVVGSFIAVRQDNLKRRLAYSTIVHLSYIVLGAALLVPLGTAGSIFHMVNHGLCKITLFLCAGAIYGTYHYENVSQLKGIGRKMPFTATAFSIASLGLIGMPGLCGFVSKVFLVRGAWQAEEIGYMIVMLGGSAFTAAYLLPIIRTAFFDAPDPAEQDHHDHDGDAIHRMRWPLMATAALVIVFGLIPWAMNGQHALVDLVVESIYGATP